MGNKTTGSATRLVCAALRAAEVVCGGVVLVIMALFLRAARNTALDKFSKEFFIALGISGSSVIVALLFLPSFNLFFRYCVLDLVLSIIWFATFALLLMLFGTTSCDKTLKTFESLATGGVCNSQRAAWGFAFLSGGLWLISFVVGFWALRKNKKARADVYEFRSGRTSVTVQGK